VDANPLDAHPLRRQLPRFGSSHGSVPDFLLIWKAPRQLLRPTSFVEGYSDSRRSSRPSKYRSLISSKPSSNPIITPNSVPLCTFPNLETLLLDLRLGSCDGSSSVGVNKSASGLASLVGRGSGGAYTDSWVASAASRAAVCV